nr:hypothetical protein [Tanacetum cinerariifolium]
MYHKKNVDFAYLLWEDFVYQVEHKDAKKSNEMYYPSFTKVIIHFFMTKDPSILRRNKNTQQFGVMLYVELTNEDIRNSAAYNEYYVIAPGVAPPKTKASVRKTQSSFDTTMPPSTAASTRLSTLAKGKQPAKSSKAIGLQQTYISQASGSGADEGTDIIPGVPDVPTDESDEEISWKSSDEDDDDDDEVDDIKEAKDKESFDPIVQTPKNSNDEGNDDVGLGLNIGGEEGPMQRMTMKNCIETSTSIWKTTPRVDVQALTIVAPLTLTAPTLPLLTIPTISEVPQAQTSPTTTSSTFLQDLSNFGSLFRFDHRLKTLEANFSEFVQTNQFAGAVFSIPGIVERYMDQRMNEAVKIIKEQVKEQVKVQVSKILPKIDKTVNEQLEAEVLTRSSNLSKTSYAIILDTYGDTITLKKRRDDSDKDEEPFVGSDRGSKRRREGKKPESISAPKEKATKTTDKSTEGSKSHQKTASESAPKQKKPPTPDCAWNKTLPATHRSIQPWISDLAKQADPRSSFNEMMDTPVDFSAFLMNRLKVDTLTPELIAGPTYELMKGSCKSLVELEFFLEEVYKATTNQLDWNNPKGQHIHHACLFSLPERLKADNTVRVNQIVTIFLIKSSIHIPGPKLISRTKGAGFCGREWGEVVWSSWSGGEVVRSGEEWVVSLAGVVG